MEFSFVHELVHRLKVFQAMTTDVPTIEPRARMRDAQVIMREARISGLPVVSGERRDKLVGIITIEDIIRALDMGHIEEPVERWMTRNVVTADRRWPLTHATSVLDHTGFGRLPVLDEDGRLCGMITPESILRALLMELNRLLAQDEVREPVHVETNTGGMRLVFEVSAGDFDRAGLASVRLKRVLAKRGVDPVTQRRVAIATHEAETNLVIHASSGGRIIATIGERDVRLLVTDDGPGIDDVEQAMQAGYSTASDFVRNLGFGAGMGLPNMRRCADKFDLTSRPGLGTRLDLCFQIKPNPEADAPPAAGQACAAQVDPVTESLALGPKPEPTPPVASNGALSPSASAAAEEGESS